MKGNYLKKLVLLLFNFSFLTGQVFAQTYSLNWNQTYGGDSRDWNCSVVTGNSGQIFLIGDSQTNMNGDKTAPLCSVQVAHADVWLMKLNSNGSIIWQRDFGGEGDERNPKLTLLNNAAGEMIFSCYSASDSACDKSEHNRDTVPILSADYWIALLDSNGIIIWEKTIGGDNYDDYCQIVQLSTGEFLVCGESNSLVGYDKTIPNYSISNDFWAVKLSATGTILGDYVYGGNNGEFLSSVLADDAGGFLLAGSSNSDAGGDVSQTGQGNQDYWMIKVDSQGNKVWDKRFGGSGPDRCNMAAMTADNGYILCGYTTSPQDGDVSQAPKGLQDYWVVKTDSAGNKQWDARYGGNSGSFGTCVIPVYGNYYWLGGYSNSNNVIDVTDPPLGGSDYWVLKIDSVGNKLFDKRFGGTNNEVGTGMSLLNDTTFLVFGASDSGSSAIKTAPSKGWYDYWLVNFTFNDGTVGISSLDYTNPEISVFPNPSDGLFRISIPGPANKHRKIEITDIAGKVLLVKNLHIPEADGISELDLSAFESGTYLIKISSPSFGMRVTKVVIY